MKSLVISGTTSSGKSTLLNLLSATWIAPVSVQPSTLSPIVVCSASEASDPSPIQAFELSSGHEILRPVWFISHKRPWHHIFNWRMWLSERRFRQMLTDCGTLQVLDALTLRTPETKLSLIELPALEKLSDENGVPHPQRQRYYADQTLRRATCNLFVFNAEETNPMVDERALSYLKRLGSVRPNLCHATLQRCLRILV